MVRSVRAPQAAVARIPQVQWMGLQHDTVWLVPFLVHKMFKREKYRLSSLDSIEAKSQPFFLRVLILRVDH